MCCLDFIPTYGAHHPLVALSVPRYLPTICVEAGHNCAGGH